MDQLTEQSVDWAMKQVRGEPIEISSLKGGTSSLLHEITFNTIEGEEKQAILREYDDEEWLAKEPKIVNQEVKNLTLVEQATFPTPNYYAVDEKGKVAGRPSVLMSKLEGHVQLNPIHFSNWLKQVAQVLHAIHSITPKKIAHHYFEYYEIENFIKPKWSKVPDKWEACFSILANNKKPFSKESFIHRDFHPTNILFKNEIISGIVDWPNACIGPREIDVGHCRWNLCMMYGLDAADLFLKYYKELDPGFNYDYFWDLEALGNVYEEEGPEVYKGWLVFGLNDITKEMMIQRMDDMLGKALAKIDI